MECAVQIKEDRRKPNDIIEYCRRLNQSPKGKKCIPFDDNDGTDIG